MSLRRKLLTAVFGPLTRLHHSNDGNVALWFGIMILPLIGMISIGVDFSRAYLVKSRLSYAIDSAALAGGGNIDAITRDEDMRMFFEANYPDAFLGSQLIDFTIAVGGDNEYVDVSAAVDVPTTFARVLGYDAIRVSEENRARLQVRGMELALIMDNTGSMGVTKMNTMKAAAHDLIDILYGEQETVPNFWVSLVPYTATVNIGNDNDGWLQNYDPNDYNPTTWKGCVEARPAPLDQSDATPAVQAFDPHFWESTRRVYGRRQGDNDWNGSNIDEDQSAGNSGLGPNLGCGPAITPLVAEKSTVDAAIDEMLAWSRGGTMANLGLAWGWRTLSPNWRGIWNTEPQLPMDYDEPLVDKVAIILTDGVNQWYDWPGGLPGAPDNNRYPDADYTAYGRLSEGRLGTTNGGNATDEVNDRMLGLCQSMKDEGITLYTITFQLNNNTTRALYEQCATSPAHYFNSPTNAELSNVFTTIGLQLSNLRLER